MKMHDEVKYMKKDFVYEQYTRIVENFKDYEKISRVKMLDEIYDVYSNYHNIIDICTTKELKYLEMILKDSKQVMKKKYDWERTQLYKKFLIYSRRDNYSIPEEILENVKEAIDHVNWNEKKKVDDLNELLVGYCKIQGSSLLQTVASLGSGITGIKEEVLWNLMLCNKLFNYYVLIYSKDIESLGKDILVAVHQDFYEIEDELDHQRQLQGLSGGKQIDLGIYRRLFYNDFDIENPKIKKFLDELNNLPFFSFSAIQPIREYAMLNLDRSTLKESFQNTPALKHIDLTDFFTLMDEAMDEMPSGALNGFTPNEARKITSKIIEMRIKKDKKYKKQKNARLSEKDSNLFYKIYFALLEFTNNKYKIKPFLKIYNQMGNDLYVMNDIIEKFWDNKEAIIIEFCFKNPFKFSKEELKTTSEMAKGFRDTFVIVKYDLEYTAFMNREKVYMVKGLKSNIDDIISYKQLPYIVTTSIMPFKNVLIYDGLLMSHRIDFGYNFEEIIENDFKRMPKCYRL